jgi:large subunit ribosomal protein L4
MKLLVYKPDGGTSEERDFPHFPSLEGEKGVQALRQTLIAHFANGRAGTASARTRSTIKSTNKKPFRQKGTGRARQGTMKGPQHEGGAVAHGPKPRDWSQSVNKKVRRLAFRRALFERAQDGSIKVIEAWSDGITKTRDMQRLVGKIVPADEAKSILLVDDRFGDSAARAARNLDNVSVRCAKDLNCHDLCRYDRIIVSESGVHTILSRSESEVSR